MCHPIAQKCPHYTCVSNQACAVCGIPHLQGLRAAVCANTSAGGAQLLRDALRAGGELAQAALTVITFLTCEPLNINPTISKAEDRILDFKCGRTLAGAY